MKILMLGWELPPHNSGGMGVACMYLSKALAEKGADIDFVVPYEAEHESIKFMNILHATHLDPLYCYGNGEYESARIEEKIISGHDGGMVSIRDVQRDYVKFIDEYLSDYLPDVVHAHDWLTYEAGVLAKRKYGVPLIAHVHATEFDRAGGHAGNQLIHDIEYEGLVMADRIIAVSEGTKRIIHDKYKIPNNKIDVAYNSLGDDFLHDDYSFNSLNYPYIQKMKSLGYTVVSTVGRLTVQKGLWHLMQAAAMAVKKEPKLLFVFAGDGEERDELIGMAAELGISKNVIFTGFIRGKQLRDIYSISDVFVMSSISEPFGLTALEAAHHNNVLILTKQSGVSEVLYSILTYDFWDDCKLADEIVAVAKNGALRDTLKQNVKNEYCRISWNDIADKCLKSYNKAIKHKRGSK